MEISQMTTAPDPEAARNHVFHCRQYMDNALDALGKNEPGKAGEMLWGSATQAVHAVDAWRGPRIGSHRDLMNFATNLDREIDDPTFVITLLGIQRLHHNFYVPEAPKETIELALPAIQQIISEVLALLPEGVRIGAEAE